MQKDKPTEMLEIVQQYVQTKINRGEITTYEADGLLMQLYKVLNASEDEASNEKDI